jgi:hypothetical protein
MRGPDILCMYLYTIPGGQVHSFVGWLKYPQGQGFIEAISIKLAGKSEVPLALEIVTLLSSMG